jgi:hypothetical protein
MGGKKITLTGADEAHFLKASKKLSRLIRFPDGVRHITLTKWQWEVFDEMIAHEIWHDLPAVAYEHALEGVTYPDDFEKQIRLSLRLFINNNMPEAMSKGGWQTCNDKY